MTPDELYDRYRVQIGRDRCGWIVERHVPAGLGSEDPLGLGMVATHEERQFWCPKRGWVKPDDLQRLFETWGQAASAFVESVEENTP